MFAEGVVVLNLPFSIEGKPSSTMVTTEISLNARCELNKLSLSFRCSVKHGRILCSPWNWGASSNCCKGILLRWTWRIEWSGDCFKHYETWEHNRHRKAEIWQKEGLLRTWELTVPHHKKQKLGKFTGKQNSVIIKVWKELLFDAAFWKYTGLLKYQPIMKLATTNLLVVY